MYSESNVSSLFHISHVTKNSLYSKRFDWTHLFEVKLQKEYIGIYPARDTNFRDSISVTVISSYSLHINLPLIYSVLYTLFYSLCSDFNSDSISQRSTLEAGKLFLQKFNNWNIIFCFNMKFSCWLFESILLFTWIY